VVDVPCTSETGAAEALAEEVKKNQTARPPGSMGLRGFTLSYMI
jgi:hypothetical protein